MSLSFTFLSFLFFTALVGVISWWFTRRVDNGDAQTYFLADRRLPWLQVAGALLLTNLSTEQLIGLNGAAAVHGSAVMAWEIVPIFALIAMAWYFLPRYWSGNITTVPEFLEQRFDRGTRRLMGAVFLITIAANLLPFVLYSGGLAMSSIFNVPQHLGITNEQSFTLMAWVIGLSGIAYVVFGGMKAVALSDTLYGAGLLVGGLAIPVFALIQLGQGEFGAGLERVLEHQAPKINPVGGPDSNVPVSTLFTGMLFINLFYWCTNQMIVQRSFGAKSFAEAQKGILATAGLKLLGPLFLVFPGVIAAEMFGAEIGNGDLAYAKLVEAVLPDYLVGFFAAVLLGSIISSFNGGLHSASTLFSMDLYRSWIRPKASDAEMLKAGKIFAVVVCLTSIVACRYLGDSPEGVFTLMKRVMAAFKLPLLAVVLVGIMARGVPPWAAKVTLVGGVGSHFLLDWLFAHGRFGVTVHWLHLAALNTVLLVAFMLASKVIAPQPERAQTEAPGGAPIAGVMDLTPWKGLKSASITVAVAAVAMYFALWWIGR
jgi:SSS family solute:Na+ symporter